MREATEDLFCCRWLIFPSWWDGKGRRMASYFHVNSDGDGLHNVSSCSARGRRTSAEPFKAPRLFAAPARHETIYFSNGFRDKERRGRLSQIYRRSNVKNRSRNDSVLSPCGAKTVNLLGSGIPHAIFPLRATTLCFDRYFRRVHLYISGCADCVRGLGV